MRTGFIKQNLNFGKSLELKGRSEKFKNPNRHLVMAETNALRTYLVYFFVRLSL
jgi:hypothetical protein